MNEYIPSPLMSGKFDLDDHCREVVQRAAENEYAKALALPTDDPVDPKRIYRVEVTWDECWAQPKVITETIRKEAKAIKDAAVYFAQKGIDHIIMVGCGDSISAMMGVQYAYETLLNIRTDVMQALDFTYYRNNLVNEKTLVICLSSSGATTRVVEAMMIARMRGAQTLCLSNTAGSILMEEADMGIQIHASRVGWPTQSSTAAMATLYQFLIDFAFAIGADAKKTSEYQAHLDNAPTLMQRALEISSEPMLEIAQIERDKQIYIFAGGGPSYTAAIFGHAKVKECSPDQAIAMQMEEFHHYNSLKAGDPLILVAPDGFIVPRAFDTASEAKRWGGQVYSVVTEGNHALDNLSDRVIYLPAIDEAFSALVYAIPTQLFGYHVAMEKYRFAKACSAQ